MIKYSLGHSVVRTPNCAMYISLLIIESLLVSVTVGLALPPSLPLYDEPAQRLPLPYTPDPFDDPWLMSLQSSKLDRRQHAQCYSSNNAPVNSTACDPLLQFMSRELGYEEPTIWARRSTSTEWRYPGCSIVIRSGMMDDIFSKADVVAEVKGILTLCRPTTGVREDDAGAGGQGPVGRDRGFVVQVLGGQ